MGWCVVVENAHLIGGISLLGERWRRILYQMTMFGFHAARGTTLAKCRPLRSAWKRLFDFSRPRGLVLREIHGSRMHLDADDRGVGSAVLLGVFEPFETELFARCVRDAMTVVDVGANVGYYSLLAARLVGATGRVFAIEANPPMYSMLLQNIAVNDYHNIRPSSCCISDLSGQARFRMDRAVAGESGMLPRCEAGREGTITVDTGTLDEILPDGVVDVLKMDIEVAECLALMGAFRLLRYCRPQIFMEFVPALLTKMGTPPADVLGMIKQHGYSVYLINEESRTLQSIVDEDKVALGGNLFCTPPDKGRDIVL